MTHEPNPDREPDEPDVAIAGLGLIGGSLARDLTAAGWRVLGFDRQADTTRHAQEAGAIAVGLDPSEPVLDAIPLVVLAVPVDAAPSLLERILPALAADAVITDTGSTKTRITAAAAALGAGDRFVGSHPMAGDHRAGFGASRTGLFRDARVWLCPGDARPEAVERIRTLWTTVGANAQTIPAADHDRMLAWTSHLPQALASALAGALADAGLHPSLLGPGGRDTTRLAASDPDLWTAVALENAPHLAEALDALEGRSAGLRKALDDRDWNAVRAFFARGRDWTREGE